MEIIGIDRKWLCCIILEDMRWLKIDTDVYDVSNIKELDTIGYYRNINTGEIHDCLFEYNNKILIEECGEHRIKDIKYFTKVNTYNNIELISEL